MVDVREIYSATLENEAIAVLTRKFMRLRSAQAVSVRVLPWLLLGDRADDFLTRLGIGRYGEGWERLPAFVWEKWWSSEDHAVVPPYDHEESLQTLKDIEGRFTGPGRYPFQVILHVNQERAVREEYDIIRELASDEDLVVTVEWRPPMRLQIAAGDRVRSGTARGTIGGFVVDGPYTFGVTCAHVVTSSQIDDLNGKGVGVAIQRTTPSPAGGAVCTLSPAPGDVVAPVNNSDFALVRMQVQVGRSGYGARPATALRQCDPIDVGGRRFTLRSLCIAMDVLQSGTSFCFAPLIELYSSSGTTQPGDSGSWGTKSGDWATMVVGADAISSFAIDARNVAQWIDGCGSVTAGNWFVL